MRILVIDDDEMSRELLAALLEARGYAVSAAESGEAALALLDSAPARPDIILTDMQMPGLAPNHLAGRLRRACGRNTLLLAMSGSRPPEAIVARYNAFLLKPFGIAELASAIESAGAAHTPARAAKGASSIRSAAPARAIRKSAPLALAASAAGPASNRNRDALSRASAHAELSQHIQAAPILDETIYRQLAGSMPAPQLHEMYAMCVKDARARIGSMRLLAVKRDTTEFMREAHAIKGSCGMLGAAELHRIAAALEKLGPDPAGSAVNSLDELSAACDRLERMLGARA